MVAKADVQPSARTTEEVTVTPALAVSSAERGHSGGFVKVPRAKPEPMDIFLKNWEG